MSSFSSVFSKIMPRGKGYVLCSDQDEVTAICSASGRATATDARALLTRKIQEIQKIHSSSVATVVDTGIGSNGIFLRLL